MRKPDDDTIDLTEEEEEFMFLDADSISSFSEDEELESKEYEKGDDSLDSYTKKLYKFKTLKKFEEVKLAKNIKRVKEQLLLLGLEEPEVLDRYIALTKKKSLAVRKMVSEISQEESAEYAPGLVIDKLAQLLQNQKTGGSTAGLKTMIKSLKISHKELSNIAKTLSKSKNSKLSSKSVELMKSFEASKKVLVESNLKLVFSRVKKFLNRGLAIEDLLQEGNLGLLKAVEKYEYEKGFKFGTYATWWIEQSFGRALADKSRLIRVPVHMVDSLNQVNRAIREFAAEKGREPTNKELSKICSMDIQKINKIKDLVNINFNKSLEDRISVEYGEVKVSDFVEDTVSEDAHSTVERDQLFQKIREALSKLSPRDEKIIRMRFGIGEKPLTLQEIGDKFGISRERVRQINNNSLKNVQSYIKRFIAKKTRDSKHFFRELKGNNFLH